MHVDNRHSADVAIAFDGRFRARAALGLSRTLYRVPRAHLQRPIGLKIARGGLQVGNPPPVQTEYVSCNDATLIIGHSLNQSFFFGANVLRGIEDN